MEGGKVCSGERQNPKQALLSVEPDMGLEPTTDQSLSRDQELVT